MFCSDSSICLRSFSIAVNVVLAFSFADATNDSTSDALIEFLASSRAFLNSFESLFFSYESSMSFLKASQPSSPTISFNFDKRSSIGISLPSLSYDAAAKRFNNASFFFLSFSSLLFLLAFSANINKPPITLLSKAGLSPVVSSSDLVVLSVFLSVFLVVLSSSSVS